MASALVKSSLFVPAQLACFHSSAAQKQVRKVHQFPALRQASPLQGITCQQKQEGAAEQRVDDAGNAAPQTKQHIPKPAKQHGRTHGRRALITKGLLAAALCPLCSEVGTASAAEWGYSLGPLGPAGWGGMCAVGEQQSPIDLALKGVDMAGDTLGKLKFNYQPADVTFFNTGHGTMQVNFPSGSNSVNVGDRTLDLVQFHFHSPSEHSMDGERLEMEVHLVHKDRKTGGLAVIGTLIESVPNHQTGPNAALSAALEYSPKKHEAKSTLLLCTVDRPELPPNCHPVQLSPESLLPPPNVGRNYYHYRGSLTTPPCSEGVDWFLMGNTVRIPDSQLVNFLQYVGDGKTIGMNTRPIQSLNGRQITKSSSRDL